ncbi:MULTISPECIES: hypothetical protein [Sorangium]|uniref:Uncharacterized protein n=1 Tax=Sorangium cellulosum TaxID=56 RepID=A0A4P2R570_SORCE|nr:MULTISPECIES: hypothetical protein [Sorangium]AUX38267.1 uncharacterized protein SOCE836_105080 [Sorangium cellulosum]WCQ97556.1 hypothetical protein NQZ70_10350 [Sorangium sp. Soce836]
MHLEFIGAAQTVTGSMHLLRTRDATVLLDCGLYQGRRAESFERNRHLPLPVHEIVHGAHGRSRSSRACSARAGTARS